MLDESQVIYLSSLWNPKTKEVRAVFIASNPAYGIPNFIIVKFAKEEDNEIGLRSFKIMPVQSVRAIPTNSDGTIDVIAKPWRGYPKGLPTAIDIMHLNSWNTTEPYKLDVHDLSFVTACFEAVMDLTFGREVETNHRNLN